MCRYECNRYACKYGHKENKKMYMSMDTDMHMTVNIKMNATIIL